MFSLDHERDTICAQSTAPGIGALAVVRLSGAKAVSILKTLAPELKEIQSHQASYAFLKDPSGGEFIDEVVATYFQAGRSFTGEDCVEISCHGSSAVVEEILRMMIASGARSALAGEFTYRAFINGRIDLVQAESVLQLIESRSRLAAKAALRQLRGGLSDKISEVCDDLTWGLSRLEANLDFSAEDIEFASYESIYEHLNRAQINLNEAVASYSSGRKVVDGVRIAIVGEPNVGKSSLLNRLVSEDRAIVSKHAGTTRDTIEAEYTTGGIRFVFIDTAGLRASTDEVEQLGIERSRAEVEKADLVLWVRDNVQYQNQRDLFQGKKVIQVLNKIDLLLDLDSCSLDPSVIGVSAKTGVGISQLMETLLKLSEINAAEDSPAVLSVRQYEMLSEARSASERGLALMRDHCSPEFVIAEIQTALRVCMRVLGKEFDDEVIDRVFRDFCLGK